jgi:hypothetical protein
VRIKNPPASDPHIQNLLLTNKNYVCTSLHTCVLIAFACKLVIQSLPRMECMCALREEANQFNVSGQPLEAMGWK